MDWYYVEDRRQRGPVSETELERRLAAGELPGDTLAWCAGLENWLAYPQAKAAAATLAAAGKLGPAALGPDEVICHECGKRLPARETAAFGERRVCAACKPLFVQKLQEGVPLTPAPAAVPLLDAKKNSLAVAGFALSVAALSASCCGPAGLAPAVIGVVLSVRGWRAAKDDPTLPHRGLAQVGIVIGIVAIVVSGVMTVVQIVGQSASLLKGFPR